MQEAYVDGYWEELMMFIRSLLHATFKGNPYLEAKGVSEDRIRKYGFAFCGKKVVIGKAC